MPKTQKRATKAPAKAAPAARRAPEEDLSNVRLDRHDLQRLILELAVQVAPADVEFALTGRERILERAHAIGSHLAAGQIELVFDCLTDHTQGRCPQIPLHTISVLGAALLYFLDEIDLIPDFIPRLGDLDDAAVFAVALSLAHAGLERYCNATGRSLPKH